MNIVRLVTHTLLSNTYPMTCAHVHLSTYENIVKIRENPVLFWTCPSLFDVLKGNRELLRLEQFETALPCLFQTNHHQQRHNKRGESRDTRNQILERVSQQQRSRPVPEHSMRGSQLEHTTEGIHYSFMFRPKNGSSRIS
jgi:hypothetical protein